MVWIATVPEEEAAGNLKRYYEAAKGKKGRIVESTLAYSLREGHLRAANVLRAAVMEGPVRLTPTEREALAVRVSALNDCHY